MKIPTDIVTKHKIRDSKICSLYSRDHWTMEEISERFKISRIRVGQILYKNRHLLEADKKFEKVKRVNHLNRILKKKEKLGDLCVTKDSVDIIKELRTETDGKEGSGGVGGETKIVIIRPDSSGVNNGAQANSQGISRSFSI